MGGLRLALTTFTVAPLPLGPVDRRTAGVAMSLAPLVGALLGLVLGGVGLGLRQAGAAPLLAAAVLVGLGVALTRGLHVDGLADTADGLGSYHDPAGALAIMKKPDIGPFGVASIVVVLLVQVAAATQALARPWPAALATIVVATAAGRLGVLVACRRGVPAARPEGLGALVAGTVRLPVLLVGTLAVGALALPVARLAPVAALGAVGVGWWLVAHATRRLGGITGDVIGATIELSATTAWLLLALS